MKKILLIFLFSISFLSAEINEYLSDVYFANGIDTTKEQAYFSKVIWYLNNKPEEELTFFTTMKVIVSNVVYSDWIKKLPQELFGNSADEDEPFWTWDIDKLEALVKQQNPAYKDVFHAVYVLKDE